MKRFALVLAFGLFACGGYTEMHEVMLRQPSAPRGGPVEIYLAEQNPGKPFWEIAMLQTIGHGGSANMEDVTRALADRAAQLGCDAVMKVHFDQGYGMAHAFGVCVRWATPQPQPSAPAPAPQAAPPPAATTAPPPAASGI